MMYLCLFIHVYVQRLQNLEEGREKGRKPPTGRGSRESSEVNIMRQQKGKGLPRGKGRWGKKWMTAMWYLRWRCCVEIHYFVYKSKKESRKRHLRKKKRISTGWVDYLSSSPKLQLDDPMLGIYTVIGMTRHLETVWSRTYAHTSPLVKKGLNIPRLGVCGERWSWNWFPVDTKGHCVARAKWPSQRSHVHVAFRFSLSLSLWLYIYRDLSALSLGSFYEDPASCFWRSSSWVWSRQG